MAGTPFPATLPFGVIGLGGLSHPPIGPTPSAPEDIQAQVPALYLRSGSAEGEVIAQFFAIDRNPNDTFTYELFDTFSNRFAIVGNELRAGATATDWTVTDGYILQVRATDQTGRQSGWISFPLIVGEVDSGGGPPPPVFPDITDITLSVTNINEHPIAGATIGTLGVVGGTAPFTITLSDNDGGRFSLTGTALKTTGTEFTVLQGNRKVSVHVEDAAGKLFDKDFVLIVDDVNEAPTDIQLSANTATTAAALSSFIGRFTATDPDPNQTFSYTLVTNAGSRWKIVGDQLQNATALIAGADTIRVRVTDQGGLTFEKNFTIQISGGSAVFPNVTQPVPGKDFTVGRLSVNALISAKTATMPAGATRTQVSATVPAAHDGIPAGTYLITINGDNVTFPDWDFRDCTCIVNGRNVQFTECIFNHGGQPRGGSDANRDYPSTILFNSSANGWLVRNCTFDGAKVRPGSSMVINSQPGSRGYCGYSKFVNMPSDIFLPIGGGVYEKNYAENNGYNYLVHLDGFELIGCSSSLLIQDNYINARRPTDTGDPAYSPPTGVGENAAIKLWEELGNTIQFDVQITRNVLRGGGMNIFSLPTPGFGSGFQGGGQVFIYDNWFGNDSIYSNAGAGPGGWISDTDFGQPALPAPVHAMRNKQLSNGAALPDKNATAIPGEGTVTPPTDPPPQGVQGRADVASLTRPNMPFQEVTEADTGPKQALANSKPFLSLPTTGSPRRSGNLAILDVDGSVLDGYDMRGKEAHVQADFCQVSNNYFNASSNGTSIVFCNNGTLKGKGSKYLNNDFDGMKGQFPSLVNCIWLGNMVFHGEVAYNRFKFIPNDAMLVQLAVTEGIHHNYFFGVGYAPGSHPDGITFVNGQAGQPETPIVLNVFDMYGDGGIQARDQTVRHADGAGWENYFYWRNVHKGGSYTLGGLNIPKSHMTEDYFYKSQGGYATSNPGGVQSPPYGVHGSSGTPGDLTFDNCIDVTTGAALTAERRTWVGGPTQTPVINTLSNDGTITYTGPAGTMQYRLTVAHSGKLGPWVNGPASGGKIALLPNAIQHCIIRVLVGGLPTPPSKAFQVTSATGGTGTQQTAASISAVSISGTSQVGASLVANFTVGGNPIPTNIVIQWKMNGVNVAANGNGGTYVPVTGDVGKTPTFTVTADNGVGAPASVTSAGYTAVAAAGGGGGGVHADATALFAVLQTATGVSVPSGWQTAINNLITGLDSIAPGAGSAWARCKWMHVGATYHYNAQKVDWKRRTTGTNLNDASARFTAKRGVANDMTWNIQTGFDASGIDPNNFTIMGKNFETTTAGYSNTWADAVVFGNFSFAIGNLPTDGTVFTRPAYNSWMNPPGLIGWGKLMFATANSMSDVKIRVNGVNAAETRFSSAIDVDTLLFSGRSGQYAQNNIATAMVGAIFAPRLTDAEIDQVNSLWNAYETAIGAL